MEDKKEKLALLIRKAIDEAASSKGLKIPDGFSVLLERPRREGQGDWATNAAMQLAKLFGAKPAELAGEIASRLGECADIAGVEVAMPGFLNFTLTDNWIADIIKDALKQGKNYGRSDSGQGRRIQVEFVSANPTGPIHLGHGRGAAVGDVVSSVLEFAGWKAEREYYINDAGLQMENLGKSTQSRYFALLGREAEAPFPKDGYPGDYIDGIAKRILDENGPSLADRPLEETVAFFRDETCKDVLEFIKKDLSDFGVSFDVWFSERSLFEGDIVPRTIALLKSRGFAYESEGAVWFRSTEFGDDKDRVMVRNNGITTYFTSDIAYLQDKYERGFDRLVYVWGADHHGYVPRIRSVNKALGASDDRLDIMLIQFVSLLRDGVPVSMSKREGTFVTLREVMDEVGRDATRFSFVNRKCDSHLEFDLEVAKRTSSDNPVYYVQYAHARICSIMREAASRGVRMPDISEIEPGALSDPFEIRLAKEISRFPEEAQKAASNLEPHRIALYASSIAEAFHAFYNSKKVLGEEERVMNARLLLTAAAKVAISNALSLLGISAPEKM
ncbi:MAG: arginine--tRNA ligase [Synergistaceae bacterium]|jgi:arginyl-tRNA synthetase|nr:arginine--tRNA ligase [Synergistaceae bacterium]